jgi:oligoendopeptidase F
MRGNEACVMTEIPCWAPAELGTKAQDIANELQAIPVRISEFKSRYCGNVSTISAAEIALACQECERLLAPLQMATIQAEARVAINSEDHGATELLSTCEQLWQVIAEGVEEFERELTELPADKAEHLLSSPDIREYANYIYKIRSATRRHMSAEVAATLSQLDSVGDWEALARQLLARITVQDGDSRVSLGSALPVLYDPDQQRRADIRAAVSAALADEVELRATALIMLTRARQARDRVSGTDDWLAAVNIDNQVAKDEVEALTDIVSANLDIVHHYYLAKAAATGHGLTDADRYAPINASSPSITWSDACDIVLTAFSRLGDEFVRPARELLRTGAVDARPRSGKRRGSLTFGMPYGRSLILVNFTGRPRDALILAHELGHAIHGRFSGTHGVLAGAAPEVLAETVALFSETLTAITYAESIGDPGWRRGFTARWVEDQMNAIFRQISLHAFESRINLAVMNGDELGNITLGEMWLEQQRALYGPAVRLGDGYQHWWSFLDNFFFAPGSLYAYAYGQLAAAGLLTLYQGDPVGFRRRYLDLLRAGGTRKPAELLQDVGLRLTNDAGWLAGIQAVRQQADSVFSITADATALFA